MGLLAIFRVKFNIDPMYNYNEVKKRLWNSIPSKTTIIKMYINFKTTISEIEKLF